MRFKPLSAFLLLAGSALLAWPSAAEARNSRLLLPVRSAMQDPSVRELLGRDVRVHFGAAVPPRTLMLGLVVEGHGVGRPSIGVAGRDSDEQVCQEAFRAALRQMVQAARQAGGSALVGVVSDYRGVEMNSPSYYECHAGDTRAVVDMRGRVARGPSKAGPERAPI